MHEITIVVQTELQLRRASPNPKTQLTARARKLCSLRSGSRTSRSKPDISSSRESRQMGNGRVCSNELKSTHCSKAHSCGSMAKGGPPENLSTGKMIISSSLKWHAPRKNAGSRVRSTTTQTFLTHWPHQADGERQSPSAATSLVQMSTEMHNQKLSHRWHYARKSRHE